MNRRAEYEKALEKIEKYTVSNPITKELVASCVKKHPADVYKSTCGKLSVLAGSEGLTGAARMACEASHRCGCGLVTLMCPDVLNTVFEITLTETMTRPVPSANGAVCKKAKDKILEQICTCDAFLMGPGLSRSDEITELVCELVKLSPVHAILDADAIYAVSKNTDVLKKAKHPVIITPHIGEFSRLVSKPAEKIIADKESYAADFAVEYGTVVVLKSHQTVVAMPNGEVYTNVFGNPGMAKGGSGDVLAGCIASFAAQTKNPQLASLAGVYFHSLAADIAVEEFGEYSLLPTDTLDYLKYAIKETYDDVNSI